MIQTYQMDELRDNIDPASGRGKFGCKLYCTWILLWLLVT